MLALLLALVAVLAWAGVAGALAARHLADARGALEGLGAASLDDPDTASAALRAARADTSAASGLLGQPGPRLVGLVPFLGRSVDSARALADAVDSSVGVAVVLADGLDGLVRAGGVDLARLEALEADLAAGAATTREPLARLTAARTAATPGPLADAVVEARERLAGVDEVLARGAAAAGALGSLLGADGDRTLLIGLENNAELRGTGGLVSVFALARTSGGRLVDVRFQQVADVFDETPEKVPASEQFVAAYGPFDADSTLWQNVTMSPDVPASASVLAEVAAVSVGVRPDDVVLLDVRTMAAIVTATGPLQLPDGSQLRGEDLVEEVLVRAYGDGQFTDDRQNVRRDRLVQIADGTFARLTEGLGSSRSADATLLRALGEMAAGRHLALWSSDPDTQARLETARLAGALDPSDGEVLATATVNNFGDSLGNGNKLDYYVERAYAVSATVGADVVEVEQGVRLTNRAPPDLGPYVQGFTEQALLDQMVELALPRDATDVVVTADGVVVPIERLEVGGVDQVRVIVTIGRGETATVGVTYRAPRREGPFRLRVLPQPLARDATLDLSVRPAPEVRFAGELPSGVVSSGPFTTATTVEVELAGPTGWDAVEEFWRSPLPRPW